MLIIIITMYNNTYYIIVVVIIIIVVVIIIIIIIIIIIHVLVCKPVNAWYALVYIYLGLGNCRPLKTFLYQAGAHLTSTTPMRWLLMMMMMMMRRRRRTMVVMMVHNLMKISLCRLSQKVCI